MPTIQGSQASDPLRAGRRGARHRLGVGRRGDGPFLGRLPAPLLQGRRSATRRQTAAASARRSATLLGRGRSRASPRTSPTSSSGLRPSVALSASPSAPASCSRSRSTTPTSCASPSRWGPARGASAGPGTTRWPRSSGAARTRLRWRPSSAVMAAMHYAAMYYPAKVLGDRELWPQLRDDLIAYYEGGGEEDSLVAQWLPCVTFDQSEHCPAAGCRCTSSPSSRTCRRCRRTTWRSRSCRRRPLPRVRRHGPLLDLRPHARRPQPVHPGDRRAVLPERADRKGGGRGSRRRARYEPR